MELINIFFVKCNTCGKIVQFVGNEYFFPMSNVCTVCLAKHFIAFREAFNEINKF